MSPIRNRFFAVLALVAAGVFAATEVARAGEDSPPAKPAAEAPKAAAPKAEAPKTDAPKTDEAKKACDTKSCSPMHTLMGWVAKQVAPGVECPCPGTEAGEKAWRTWFAGGKDVPLASLRDAMVADGWNADKFVTFFKEQQAKKAASKAGGCDCKDGKDCAKGDCAKGDCAKGDCSKGDCKGGCPCKDGAKPDAAKTDAPKTEPAPVPAKPEPAASTK